jgi:endonuclease/exonuclease/phosphatase family metal-dependent hydrolase
VRVLALTWNLYHGRSLQPAGRSLLNEFAQALAGWEWDVALLQEVPPWWPQPLAVACGAQWRRRLTSRNFGLWLRREISARNPDLLKSNGGGCNAILVRGEIVQHRSVRLCWRPERRYAHGVQLGDGSWVVNTHTSTHHEEWARRDAEKAVEFALRWAGGAPLLFGGDVNIRGKPELSGLVRLGGNHVDHLYSSGPPARSVEVLERGRLSDHAPVRVSL